MSCNNDNMDHTEPDSNLDMGSAASSTEPRRRSENTPREPPSWINYKDQGRDLDELLNSNPPGTPYSNTNATTTTGTPSREFHVELNVPIAHAIPVASASNQNQSSEPDDDLSTHHRKSRCFLKFIVVGACVLTFCLGLIVVLALLLGDKGGDDKPTSSDLTKQNEMLPTPTTPPTPIFTSIPSSQATTNTVSSFVTTEDTLTSPSTDDVSSTTEPITATATTSTTTPTTITTTMASTAAPIRSKPLAVVGAAAPDKNCIYFENCSVTVSDCSASFGIPSSSSGEAFLQSRRSANRGETGAPAQGLYMYEYRLSLTAVVAPMGSPCVTRVQVEVGRDFVELDYNFDGQKEPMYEIRQGGLGDVRITAATLISGKDLVLEFANAGICAGQTSYFIGFSSARKPRRMVPATAVLDDGSEIELDGCGPSLI